MPRKLKFLPVVVFAVLLVVGCGDGTPVAVNPDSPAWTNEKSAARVWNDALLEAIRRDFARPTVHARNLFHSSAMMYDLWAVYDGVAKPFFLGNTVGGYACPFPDEDRDDLRAGATDPDGERSIAISYAMYRLLTHRFRNSPGVDFQLNLFEDTLVELGFSPLYESRDYLHGTRAERAAALGLYLSDCVVEYGLLDGSNEEGDYAGVVYESVNPPLRPEQPGNPTIVDPDLWQPLDLEDSIDQSGNQTDNLQAFVGAEWGRVIPFALPAEAFSTFERPDRDDAFWPVCYDPGAPALLRGEGALPDEYLWNHEFVAIWSSHLDPADGVMWDISPGTIGNAGELPQDIASLRDYYNLYEGGVYDTGHPVNPYTGEPYEPNIVPRGDYARVLTEFWADGPDSETPPGHWFTVVNLAVSDHPAAQKRYKGTGPVLTDLEWDVKVYFALGGGIHDSAVTAWGIKGWYDYVRPISAIRFMADRGQSTDDTLPNYDPEGLPLIDGYVEVVEEGDPLAGDDNENVGKIKLFAWRGTSEVNENQTDTAGVGWMLAENWVPYQRPTFVTPPFAGYISGHSTFSRAAAEILTEFTGDEYFPGGLGEFVAPKNEFLETEEGPTVDVVLQWATYRDASDQTSLSRIWGGIHPPVDDIFGRRLGIVIAADAMDVADAYFRGENPAH
ncbi:vanadium-dependent haloperoxidase [bacterium]|nr:vanadium-dependent haloperoxidase [bacterium]